MAEHERATQNKQADIDQKHRIKQQDSEPLSSQIHDWGEGISSMTEYPFNPRMDEHAEILSSIPFSAQRREFMMQLHQTYGNRYVQRLLNSNVVQAKLTVNAPGDIYEQEADRIADEVISAEKSQVHRQEEEEEEEKEEEEEEEEVQAQSSEGQPDTVSESIEARINNARGSGHALSENVREPMEQAFGADFSDVRVHTDSEANLLNQQISAKAFTTARDIFFRQGEYSPGSETGKKLIAHELTHVVQQSSKAVSPDNSAFEPEAVQTEIARATDGKIQRLKKYKLDATGDVIANQPPEIINIGTLSYEKLIDYQWKYNQEKVHGGLYKNIEFEEGDIDKINQKIADIEETGIRDVVCLESQVKVAQPTQQLIHKGVDTCLTITCELEDGTLIGAHEAWDLHVEGGVIGALRARIQQEGKTVSKVSTKGKLEGWKWEWKEGGNRILGRNDEGFSSYDICTGIGEDDELFNDWLKGHLGAGEAEGPKDETGDITFPARQPLIGTKAELFKAPGTKLGGTKSELMETP